MPYILNGTTIRRPQSIDLVRSVQQAQIRTLDGKVSRDHFGDEKRSWTLRYRNVLATDYTTIETIYNLYLTNQSTISFESTEGNYTVASTQVHIDLQNRTFRVPGTSYISDFDLVLTEE